MTTRQLTDQQVTYARIAGLFYLFIILTAFFGAQYINANIIFAGARADLADNIRAHPMLFRCGVVSTILMYAAVIILSGLLYMVLRPVNKCLALIALLLRVAEGVIGATLALLSFIALEIISTGDVSGVTALHPLISPLLHAQRASMNIVLLFVGIGGALFCWLFFMARLVPRPLSLWGVVTYASIFLLALVSMLFPARPAYLETIFFGLGGAFELLFGAWLLVKSIRTA